MLVLDNCEHLVGACAQLADTLLRACPDICTLATSRAVLDVPGETAWRVPALDLPTNDGRQTLEQVARAEAVRLFTERAQAARPEFALDARTAQAVASICQRLDGLPLSIELAGVLVRVLDILRGCQAQPLLSEADQTRLVELVVAAQAPGWDPGMRVLRAPGGAQDLWPLAG